jgi:hypothetical protein
MSVWEQRSRDAAPTRTVTGAILALHETQRLVVGGKTGHHVLRRESEMGFCVPIDPGGEMVTPIPRGSSSVWSKNGFFIQRRARDCTTITLATTFRR